MALDATFAAKAYKNRNWSVIPLLGSRDSSRAKHPAIKWGRYQHSIASDQEIEDWFLHQGYDALGIVLGRVSRLVVLDFDDPARVSEFRHLYPHLTDTYTVQSGIRHLPHYYYALPDGLNVYSRHVPGIDFRADGNYVVAPPTCVGDAEWRLVQDGQPRVLSADDLKAISRFLVVAIPDQAEKRLETPSHSIIGQSMFPLRNDQAVISDVGKNRRNSDTLFDPVILYRARVAYGRNKALFDVAVIARDGGRDEQWTRDMLAGVHALQPDSSGCRESFGQRYVEALRTIHSVYSRPARIQTEHAVDNQTVGIPTPTPDDRLSGAVREKLLQCGLVAAARVLDGLYLAGLRIGSMFTEREAGERLNAFGIGRRSVMAALKTRLSDGEYLFARAGNSPCNPHVHASAAIPAVGGEITKCDLVTGAKRVKIPGRPPCRYVFPDAGLLAQRLGVGIPTVQVVEQVKPDDLGSSAAYRRGLHRELVKRRPGQYTRRWLAGRLGVSKWTCRRYEAKLEMQVQPMYGEQHVTWTNLESLLPLTSDDIQPGTFLEVEGKRYPPLRSIAVWLLSTKRSVFYKRQEGNYYRVAEVDCLSAVTSCQSATVGIPTLQRDTEENSHSHSPPLLDIVSQNSANQKTKLTIEIPTPQDEIANRLSLSFWLCPDCLKTHIQSERPSICSRCGSQKWQRVPEVIWRDQDQLKLWWQKLWREKYPDAPRRATPLVSNVPCMSTNALSDVLDSHCEAAAAKTHHEIKSLSLKTARKLVQMYGVAVVNQAVRRVLQRESVNNPAGLLITLLRSEHLFCSRPRELQVLSDGGESLDA